MKGILLLGAILCVAASAAECQRPQLATQRAVEVRRTIVAWLECQECIDGELNAVVRLGQAAVPTLAATLAGGPSPASREALRRHLVNAYRELKEYERTKRGTTVTATEDEYVRTYMDNYVALYKARAAEALGRIGGDRARRALEAAAREDQRPDVRSALQAALTRVR